MNLSRPGPRFLTTWLAQFVTGKSYRYKPEDYRYHGRQETQVSDPFMKAVGPNSLSCLSTTGRELLMSLKKTANNRGVRLVYSMPWQYTAENHIQGNRVNRKSLLEDIQRIIPVIDDGFTGCINVASYFSDSQLHLTANGSTQRTMALAPKLNAWLNLSSQ